MYVWQLNRVPHIMCFGVKRGNKRCSYFSFGWGNFNLAVLEQLPWDFSFLWLASNFPNNITPESYINPLHPNISMHILHTVLLTFPKVMTRRICLPIESFFAWWSFPFFLWPWCVIQRWYCKEKLDVSHYKE